MINKENIQNLLIKLEAIAEKYKNLAEITGNNFNIFQILKLSADEVKTHSAFVAELLNPEGSHSQGNVFLDLFIAQINEQLKKEGNIAIDEDAIVEVEKFIGEKTETEGGRIDIIVTDKNNNAIIIENKIYAGDQENQLLRYFNYGKTLNKFWLIYLTLDGKNPSDFSTGKNDELNFITISYKETIKTWLERCREKTVMQPIIRETITQYINLINNLTGQTMNDEEKEELYEFLAKKNYMQEAQKIVENWQYIKWKVEWQFWTDLEKVIKGNDEKYKILEYHQKFTSNNLDSVIYSQRYKNPWYGIMIELFLVDEEKFCMYIERGFGKLYYGITVLDKEKKRVEKIEEKYKGYSDKLKKKNVCQIIQDTWWLGYNHVKKEINFEKFSDSDTLLLINEEIRIESVKEVWNEMKDCINKTKEVFNQ